ncbi:hypothetical protein [Luteimonas mephitis]|uniref:hypothetical protein n=1 Tax=Luteimonas mephitis TaxID=83615 RepID=UPI003A8D14E3
MANSKQATARRVKMAERARQQKELHFPEVHEDWLWHRTRHDGFISLPRTMPLVMEAVDALSNGHAAGKTLLTLWCRAPDHALVTIESPAVFAAEAGFTGQRAVDSWRRRMRKLVEIGFIVAKSGAAGDFHYILLKNPHWVMEWLHHAGQVPMSIYGRFLERAMEVGAFGEIETVRQHIIRWQQEATATATLALQPPNAQPPVAAKQRASADATVPAESTD